MGTPATIDSPIEDHPPWERKKEIDGWVSVPIWSNHPAWNSAFLHGAAVMRSMRGWGTESGMRAVRMMLKMAGSGYRRFARSRLYEYILVVMRFYFCI